MVELVEGDATAVTECSVSIVNIAIHVASGECTCHRCPHLIDEGRGCAFVRGHGVASVLCYFEAVAGECSHGPSLTVSYVISCLGVAGCCGPADVSLYCEGPLVAH